MWETSRSIARMRASAVIESRDADRATVITCDDAISSSYVGCWLIVAPERRSNEIRRRKCAKRMRSTWTQNA